MMSEREVGKSGGKDLDILLMGALELRGFEL